MRERTDAAPGGPLEILRRDAVTSTQDEAARRAADGQQTPFALTARHQSGGRGRLGRSFASPDGASLALTVAHRSRLAADRRGWFSLAAGVAAIAALDQVLGATGEERARIGLKWPNDLHTADGRKLGGILVEGRGPDLVLLGIGINLRGPVLQADGRAVPGAAWLRGDDGVRPGADGAGDGALRERLESALAAALAQELSRLESAGGDGVSAGTHERYTMTCLTLGRAVRVDPLGEAGMGGAHPSPLHGIARMIDEHGRLVIDLPGGGRTAVDIGDVRHLRPDDPVRPTTRDAMAIEQEEHGT
ncbi:biotin--acetyl-CoA-carboxylase ligase [Brachybacterium vulturis]|uniref:Biotin--acetyl-CoA-carboxylase ligase n=1 Tax=Brachybacterium vulturis TaxID=2017484 RepID=A0A291GM11_9MICO|nr:biotin--acetyl-CoA-carboxylase ligase [Brachybacterium vulturis]ATG51543.1 biotin--acetyl-CoA-carboxylase ligase [Brachybacterium vulturis]